ADHLPRRSVDHIAAVGDENEFSIAAMRKPGPGSCVRMRQLNICDLYRRGGRQPGHVEDMDVIIVVIDDIEFRAVRRQGNAMAACVIPEAARARKSRDLDGEKNASRGY